MNEFQLRGKAAEDFLYELAQGSFLTDWCYTNPLLRTGKELCDLLVIFDEIAIIWQVKNVKLDKGQFPKSEVEKNLRQICGAKRQLVKLKSPIDLKNPRRGAETLDPSSVRSTFLINALLGGEADFAAADAQDPSDGQPIHTFTRGFTETVLGELDTMADFVAYLEEKEKLLEGEQRLILLGGEEQLLAYYLTEGRSFASMAGFTDIMLDEDIWAGYKERPEVAAKKKKDEVSYFWDRLIDRAHESGMPEYEQVARELARPDRFRRRVLSKSLLEGLKNPKVSRRFLPAEGTTYCFVTEDLPREQRRNLLELTCYVARDQFRENTKVLGIAMEKTIRKADSYVDYCLLDYPIWTDEQETAATRIRRDLGILRDPRRTPFSEEEYP